MQTISSIKDPKIIEARQLTSSIGRKQIEKCLLETIEAIRWALQAKMNIEHIFITRDVDTYEQELKLLIANIRLFNISEGIAKKVTDTNYIVPIIGVMQLPKTNALCSDFTIVLDGVKDFGNIGTIVRTAAAFDINNFVSTNMVTDFYYRKTIDSSRGSVFSSNLVQYGSTNEALTSLKKKGFFIIATSPHARQIQSLIELPQKPIALVIGNETSGISTTFEESADLLVQIPMSGEIESLNAGVAAGISIYEINLKRILSMLSTLIRSTLGRQFFVVSQLIKDVFDVELKKISVFSGKHTIFMMMMHCDGKMSRQQAMLDTSFKDSEFEEFLKPLFFNKVLVTNDNGASFQLTLSGEEYLAKIWPVVESSHKAILNGFSEQDKLILNDYISRIQHNCMNIIQNFEKPLK
jgi:RNA methyltransferase, TrmH family